MPDVFLSYSREDREVARRFAEAFQAHGFDVWWDAALRSGEIYDEVTEKALRAARAVVVLWSKTSVMSRWVRAEATLANRHKTLVPAMIEPCDLPILFELTQTAELTHWTGDPADEAWTAFLADVRRNVEGERSPTEASAALEPRSAPAPGAASQPIGTKPLATPDASHAAWRRAQRPAVAAAIVAVLALAGWGVWAVTTGSGARAVRTAVLPFAAPAGDAPLRAFADGLINEITDVTAQIGVATVARDQTNDLRGAEGLRRAAQLGATFVLGGDVRHDGDLLIAAVRLDDPRTGTTLWSQQFEQPAAETRDLRLRVATQAVSVVQCAHDARQSRGGNISNASLAAYLRACSINARETSSVEIRDIMAKLTAAEPRFAVAFGYLAVSSVELAEDDGTSDSRRSELHEEARAAAQRAIALDPRSGEAYIALSSLEGQPGHWTERERWLREGLRRNPGHASMNTLYGNLLREVGALRDATAYLERGVAGDPLSPFKTGNLAWALFIAGREADAQRVLDGMAPKWPDTDSLWFNRMRVALYAKRPAEVAQLLKGRPRARFEQSETDCWRVSAEAIADPQRTASVRAAADCIDRGFTDPWQSVQVLGAIGKVDEAYALVAANMDHPFFYPGAFFVPATASLRRDPRFMPLMQKIGLVDYWRTSGRWPDFCEEPDLPFKCEAEAARLTALK